MDQPLLLLFNINQWQTLASILIAIFAYLLFLMISASLQDKFTARWGKEKGNIYRILFKRITGFVLFGIIPIFIILTGFSQEVTHFGLKVKSFPDTIYWTGGFMILLIALNAFIAPLPATLKTYPQIQVSSWTRKLLFINFVSWMFYLLGYEFMLRGFLLFSCLIVLGKWPAIMISSLIYMMYHAHKPKREIYGAFIFGMILGYLVIYLENLWISYFGHVALAISTELFAIKARSKMAYGNQSFHRKKEDPF